MREYLRQERHNIKLRANPLRIKNGKKYLKVMRLHILELNVAPLIDSILNPGGQLDGVADEKVRGYTI